MFVHIRIGSCLALISSPRPCERVPDARRPVCGWHAHHLLADQDATSDCTAYRGGEAAGKGWLVSGDATELTTNDDMGDGWTQIMVFWISGAWPSTLVVDQERSLDSAHRQSLIYEDDEQHSSTNVEPRNKYIIVMMMSDDHGRSLLFYTIFLVLIVGYMDFTRIPMSFCGQFYETRIC